MQGTGVRRKCGWFLMALLLVGTTSFLSETRSTTAQTADQLNIGLVSALAIDNVGGGWGWSGPANPNDAGHLIRLDSGAWREDTRDSPVTSVFKDAAAIYQMAVTGDGKSGWALGTGGGLRIWKLVDGTWQNATNPFGPDVVWNDLTLSADGSDGWIVAGDSALHYQLARLSNGEWKLADQPQDAEIAFISISPDGTSGWGVGVGHDLGTHVAMMSDKAVQFDKNGWVQNTSGNFTLPYNTVSVTADNLGNGWAVGPPINSVLMRLKPDGATASELDPATTQKYPGIVLQSVQVNGMGRGWATGSYNKSSIQMGGPAAEQAQVLFWLNGDSPTELPFTAVPAPAPGQPANYAGPLAVSPDGAHAWVAISSGESKFLSMVELREGWMSDKPAQADPLPGAGVCFAESLYCLRGAFAQYWQTHGGVDSLGFPITPEITETQTVGSVTTDRVVQYTERARLELHPEFKGTPYEVLLGLLGNSLAEPRLSEQPFQPKPASAAPDTRWFEATGHNLAPPMLNYWTGNGGLDVFGYPRSEQFMEQNHADGKLYTVQYFERNRIEYHPENQGTKYEFQLGLLGVEQFGALYGYTP
jgi:hypothetical protein